jgi:hypothetical protein
MSEAISLLNDLRGRRFRVSIAGPKLRIVPKPDDAELIERSRAHKAELMALLKEQAEIERIARLDAERNEADRIAKRGYDHDPEQPSHREYVGRTPAAALIKACLEHGVGLRVEADGTLVVASNGKAWRSLIDALEAHVDEVAALILNGWSPYDA